MQAVLWSDQLVKLVYLLLVTVAFSSCTTLANRRDMFTPDGYEGPYTKKLRGHEHRIP
jgi:hypothetical protein